jgi:hypothetical protein
LKTSRVVLLLAAGLAALGALWLARPAAAPPPALIEELADDGLRGAPCPARSLYEQDARKKQGVRPEAGLGRRLREKFPLGSDEKSLATELDRENFARFTPCPNDESVSGARWLSPNWGRPDAFVYWRADDAGKLTFLDGHVSRAE